MNNRLFLMTYFKCEICKKVMYKSEKAQHQCWTGEDAAEFEEQPDSVPYFGSNY